MFINVTIFMYSCMKRKKITLTCDENVWKEFRKKAIEEGEDYSHLVEKIIKKYLSTK